MTDVSGGSYPPTLPGTDGPLSIDNLHLLADRLERNPGLTHQVGLKFSMDHAHGLRFLQQIDGHINGEPYIFWVFQVPFRGRRIPGREYGRVYLIIPKSRGTGWGRHIAVYSANTSPEIPALVVERLIARLR